MGGEVTIEKIETSEKTEKKLFLFKDKKIVATNDGKEIKDDFYGEKGYEKELTKFLRQAAIFGDQNSALNGITNSLSTSDFKTLSEAALTDKQSLTKILTDLKSVNGASEKFQKQIDEIIKELNKETPDNRKILSSINKLLTSNNDNVSFINAVRDSFFSSLFSSFGIKIVEDKASANLRSLTADQLKGLGISDPSKLSINNFLNNIIALGNKAEFKQAVNSLEENNPLKKPLNDYLNNQSNENRTALIVALAGISGALLGQTLQAVGNSYDANLKDTAAKEEQKRKETETLNAAKSDVKSFLAAIGYKDIAGIDSADNLDKLTTEFSRIINLVKIGENKDKIFDQLKAYNKDLYDIVSGQNIDVQKLKDFIVKNPDVLKNFKIEEKAVASTVQSTLTDQQKTALGERIQKLLPNLKPQQALALFEKISKEARIDLKDSTAVEKMLSELEMIRSGELGLGNGKSNGVTLSGGWLRNKPSLAQEDVSANTVKFIQASLKLAGANIKEVDGKLSTLNQNLKDNKKEVGYFKGQGSGSASGLFGKRTFAFVANKLSQENSTDSDVTASKEKIAAVISYINKNKGNNTFVEREIEGKKYKLSVADQGQLVIEDPSGDRIAYSVDGKEIYLSKKPKQGVTANPTTNVFSKITDINELKRSKELLEKIRLA